MTRLGPTGLILLGCLLAGGPAAAQEEGAAPNGASAPAAAKTKKAARPRVPPAGATSLQRSLNAPSTDFTDLNPEFGDEGAPRRQKGPAVRPSISSSGAPGMGVGF